MVKLGQHYVGFLGCIVVRRKTQSSLTVISKRHMLTSAGPIGMCKRASPTFPRHLPSGESGKAPIHIRSSKGSHDEFVQYMPYLLFP